MKFLLFACLPILAFPSEGQEVSIYNNAKVIFHALGPHVHSELAGIDPSTSVDVLERLLAEFSAVEEGLSEEMISRIEMMRKSLLAAKQQYWSCNGLVGTEDGEKIDPIARHLSLEVEKLSRDPSHPPLLFIGGHYFYADGSMKGHTATYEVIRQKNGSLSFIVNNTTADLHHESDGNRIYQLVYTDLTPQDLDDSFWKNVIQTNYMTPPKGKLMDSFYTYLNTRLHKKTVGRAFKKQGGGVCAWKSLTVWVRGYFDKHDHSKFKRFMFESLLSHFHPDESLTATVKFEDRIEPAAIFLKNELTKKIEKYQ